MEPELLPGSGTRKIQSWIRNKSLRIRNTGFEDDFYLHWYRITVRYCNRTVLIGTVYFLTSLLRKNLNKKILTLLV